MLTSTYRKKLDKYEKVITFLYKFRIIILVAFVFIGATIATLMSIKGIVINEVILEDTEYGKDLNYSCKAILCNDMYYEFGDANGENWTKTEPRTPGEYTIRGVSKNVFNKDRRGKAYTFKILPKTSEITLDNTFVYGANDASVGLNFNLEYNDKVIDIQYEILSVTEEQVSFKLKNNFKIVNAAGEDITSYYNFNIHDTYVGKYSKINLTLETKGEIEYDEKEHQGNEVEITSGSLFNNDKLSVAKRDSFKAVGRYTDNPEIKITSNNGVDVTNLYNYSYTSSSKFIINKRKLEVDVGDFSRVYDGKSLEKEMKYTIKSGSLISNHTLKVYLPEKIDAGTYNDSPKVSLVDKDGNNQLSNYDFKLNYGTYTITKRPITVNFEMLPVTYDGYGTVKYNRTYKDSDLVEGHEVVTIDKAEKGAYLHAKTYDSYDVDIAIFGKDNNVDYSKNYDITIKTSSFEVHKYSIKIKTESTEFIYNGQKHSYPLYEIVGEYPETDSFNIKSYTEEIEAGEYENKIEFEINNFEFGDVTNDYDIEFEYGTIKITKNHHGDDSTNDGDIFIDDGGSGELIPNDGYNFDEIGDDEKSDTVVFRYTPYSDGNVFLISNTSYGTYTGKGFNPAPNYEIQYGQNPQEFITDILRNKVQNKYGVLDYYNINYRQIDLVGDYPYLDRIQDHDNINIVSDLQTQYIDLKMLDFDYYEDYEILDGLTQTNEKVILEEENYCNFVYENYFGFGSGVKDKYQKYIDKYSIKDDTVIGLATKIKALFDDGFKYSATNLEASKRSDPIYSFLTETKIGKCDYFATAATIFYRLNGFPARMIGGWSIPVTSNDVGKTLDIKEERAHAITQVYLKGKGWVSFDFTIGSTDDAGGGDGGGTGEIDTDQYDLIIHTDSSYKTFDGEPLKGTEATITGNLKEGHKFYYSNASEITRAGTIFNKPIYVILDQNGKDVTSSYNIYEDFGYLVINKRQILVETYSRTFEYDGERHYVYFDIIGLLNDFGYSWYSSSYVEKGTYDNVAVVCDIFKFIDVTQGYDGGVINYFDSFDIEYDYGIVTII